MIYNDIVYNLDSFSKKGKDVLLFTKVAGNLLSNILAKTLRRSIHRGFFAALRLCEKSIKSMLLFVFIT